MIEAVRVREPSGPYRPFVASIPHGSTMIPTRFASLLTVEPDRLWVDAFTPELYAFVGDFGAITVEATLSRFVADPNRDPDALLFAPFWEGIVASTNSDGEQIYAAEPPESELVERVLLAHTAYHRALDDAVERLCRFHDSMLLLDLHSFGTALDADVVLGDGRGTTASPAAVSMLETALTDHGFSVVRNVRFSGGWTVRRFAANPRVDAIQVELNQRCYIDPEAVEAYRLPRPYDPERIRITATRLRLALAQALTAYEADELDQ